MLFNIQNGYGVTQRDASEIMYLCFRRRVLDEFGCQWCFTDGHAKQAATRFFASHESLAAVDVEAINERFWASRRVMEDDPDVRRRKQAELLVREYLPADAILHVLVADVAAKNKATQFVVSLKGRVPVFIADYSRFYY